MNPALWGGLSALGLGTADFLGRFSARGVGAASAWLGVVTVGTALLSAWVLLARPVLIWDPAALWLVALNGAATTVMTVLLYWGLARGPVSVVAPIVASHPVLVVGFWVVLGARLAPLQWLAMAGVVAGVALVARAGRTRAPGTPRPIPLASHRGEAATSLRGTLLIAAGATLAYAVLVIAGQAAVPVYGEFQTLWLGRIASLATIAGLFAIRRRGPALTRRWWPVVGAQGCLDAAGYLFLFAGSHGDGAAVAAVVASTFGAVTTVLARVVLKESIGVAQWIGIGLVFAGVAVLSATS